jgi:hypothetical protein
MGPSWTLVVFVAGAVALGCDGPRLPVPAGPAGECSPELVAAVRNENATAIVFLRDRGARSDCRWMQEEMRVALNDGNWSRLRHVLLAGVNPDSTNARYYCSQPLLLAFRMKRSNPGYTTALKSLLDAGANPNEWWPQHCYRQMPGAPRVARSTPLTVAAATGDAESARMLLHAGADAAIRDERGWTAEDYAKLNTQAGITALLRHWREFPPNGER